MKRIRTNANGAVADQFNYLKYRVVGALNGKAHEPVAIAFVSMSPGEGVTSVTANFALSLSTDPNYRILLVDGNLERPALHNLIETTESKAEPEPPSEAQKSLLVHELKLTRLNKNLELISSKWSTGNGPTMFKMAELKMFLTKAKEQYDFVLIDCPPLNGISNSALLASKVDYVVLVVEAGRIRRQVLRQAITQLEMMGANILGVVLNKREYPIPRFIYRML